MKTTLCLLDVDYVVESNEPVVRLWCADAQGGSVMLTDRTMIPYFYIEPKSDAVAEALKKRLVGLRLEGSAVESVETVRKRLLGKEKLLLKVMVRLPADVAQFRDAVKGWPDVRDEYEYTIPFAKRYLIDRGLVPMGWFSADTEGGALRSSRPLERREYPRLKVMAFDIETVQEGGRDGVIMISAVDSSRARKVISYGKGKVEGVDMARGEREMIQAFLATVQEGNPHLIVGYNSDRFDVPKLDERAKHYGMRLSLGREGHVVFERRGRVSAASLTGRVHVDLYDFIENILAPSLSTEALTLDRVSRELTGRGKTPMEWKDIEEAWARREVKKIATYCLQDSLLTLQLADYLLPQMMELCRLTGQMLFDTSRMFYSQLVEWLYIRKAHEAGELVPNRPKDDEIQRRRKVSYLGGYVHTPREGIHENIAVFDFTSLYPSITITHNVSPETLDCSCCADGKNTVPDLGHHYCMRQRGFVPAVLQDLVVKRVEIKERMKSLSPDGEEYRYLNNRQYALKILANASYGYYAYPGSRWYSKVCAESITALGRMYIKSVILLAEKAGFPVIYGDTDSLFLRMNKGDVRQFQQKVNAILPGVMELDFKGFYPAGIFVLGKGGVAAKKRYALIDEEGRLLIRGFERVRRDWSGVAKETQERVLSAVLKDRDPEKAVRLVQRIIAALRRGKAGKEQLIIYTQLVKPIDAYEQVGPHVAVARKIIARGGSVMTGATISYIVTRGSGSISDRAEPPEDAKDYDPDYYINNQVLPAAMRILAGMGYREEDLLQKKAVEDSQSSLKKYLK